MKSKSDRILESAQALYNAGRGQVVYIDEDIYQDVRILFRRIRASINKLPYARVSKRASLPLESAAEPCLYPRSMIGILTDSVKGLQSETESLRSQRSMLVRQNKQLLDERRLCDNDPGALASAIKDLKSAVSALHSAASKAEKLL